MTTTQSKSSTPHPKKKRSSSKTSSKSRRCNVKPQWRDYVTTKKPVGNYDQGHRVIKWIERHCVHTNDRWLGKPFRLLPWQKWIILALFTTGADGLRIIRWALIGIGKKNGKTELAAALACYFAFGPSGPDGNPEPAALVVCAAGSDDQADLVFGAAKVMCEQSPTLSQITETFEAEILCPSLPGSKIIRVAAAAKKTSSNLDGKNIYVVICDELHCWEGPQARVVWDTLTNGTVTRRQPMVFQITTAGFDLETVCGEQYLYGKSVASGETDDPRFFFWWVEPPEGADHTDPDVIAAANPSFGVIATLEFYVDQLTKKTEAVFRRYFLNQWTEAAETWLPQGTWEAGDIGPFTFLKDVPLVGATDAATKWDSTALVRAQRHTCDEMCPGWNGQVDKFRLTAAIWERPYDPRTRRPLEGWKLPSAEIENTIREYASGHQMVAWAYDSAHFHRSAEQLESEGLPMEDFPQTDSRMVPAAQMLFQLLMDGKVEHDGDAVFARHIRAAVAVQARGGNGGWRLAKGKTKKKMDAAVAAAMAIWLASQEVEKKAPALLISY
jgi:phage terminase large subunit-like protein